MLFFPFSYVKPSTAHPPIVLLTKTLFSFYCFCSTFLFLSHRYAFKYHSHSLFTISFFFSPRFPCHLITLLPGQPSITIHHTVPFPIYSFPITSIIPSPTNISRPPSPYLCYTISLLMTLVCYY